MPEDRVGQVPDRAPELLRAESPRDPRAYFEALVGVRPPTGSPTRAATQDFDRLDVTPGLIAPGALADAFRRVARRAEQRLTEARRRIAA